MFVYDETCLIVHEFYIKDMSYLTIFW